MNLSFMVLFLERYNMEDLQTSVSTIVVLITHSNILLLLIENSLRRNQITSFYASFLHATGSKRLLIEVCNVHTSIELYNRVEYHDEDARVSRFLVESAIDTPSSPWPLKNLHCLYMMPHTYLNEDDQCLKHTRCMNPLWLMPNNFPQPNFNEPGVQSFCIYEGCYVIH